MAKRYATGKFPTYDNAIVKYRNESQIMNPATIPSVFSVMWDKPTMLSYQRQYKGTEPDGRYKVDKNEWAMGIVPATARDIKDLEAKFTDYCQQKMNQGYAMPTEWPPEMMERKLMLEAKLDVAKEELAKIEGKLETMQEREENRDDSRVLKYGLVGTGRLYQGVLVEIDGMEVGRAADETMIIHDKRSPYNGMAVSDYRELGRQWLAEIRRADAVALKARQAKARAEGKPVPVTHSSIGTGVRVKRELIPMWPEGVVNHLEPIETK